MEKICGGVFTVQHEKGAVCREGGALLQAGQLASGERAHVSSGKLCFD